MNSIWGNIFSPHFKNKDSVFTILRKVPVFEDLSDREVSKIENILHKREYTTDEIIFRQGDPGLGMYIIESGNIDILRDPAGQVLAGLSDGDFFGELALLDDSPRTATAIARSEARLLCFFHPDLLDLLQRNPGLGVKVLFRLARTLGDRLKKTNEDLQEIQKAMLNPDEPARTD